MGGSILLSQRTFHVANRLLDVGDERVSPHENLTLTPVRDEFSLLK